jgi:hypothetical protein
MQHPPRPAIVTEFLGADVRVEGIDGTWGDVVRVYNPPTQREPVAVGTRGTVQYVTTASGAWITFTADAAAPASNPKGH